MELDAKTSEDPVPYTEGQQRQSNSPEPIVKQEQEDKNIAQQSSDNLETKEGTMASDTSLQSLSDDKESNLSYQKEKVGTLKRQIMDIGSEVMSHWSWQKQVGALKHQLNNKESEVTRARAELQYLQGKLEDVTALLEVRTRELRGTQVFLTTVDKYPGTEVIALVDAFNHEIMQTCAVISDSFDFVQKPEHTTAEIDKACTKINEIMGPTMMRLLRTVRHSRDPLLVQVALQGAMINFSHRVITTWDYDHLGAHETLTKIYSNMIRTTETQAIRGRWRALTRAHAQKMTSEQQHELHSAMVKHICDILVATIVAAGCTKSYDGAYHQFKQSFGDQVANIVKMAVQLNKVVGEEVVSADLSPIEVTTGKEFDGATMEDFAGQGDHRAGELVLCTTALGLYRSEKVTVGDSIGLKNSLLKKPTVALESMADGLGWGTVEYAVLKQMLDSPLFQWSPTA